MKVLQPSSAALPVESNRLVGLEELARAVAAGVYVGLLVASIVGNGVPDSPAGVLRWLGFGAAVVAVGTRWRLVGLIAFGGAFVASAFQGELPINDRDQMLLWLVGAIALVAIGRDPKSVLRLVRDWLPFVAVLMIYDYSRGAATHLGMPLQVMPQIHLDRWLAFGHVPTIWLQQRLLQPHHYAWWEGAVLLVYLSHFVVSYAVAAWLWARDHDAWWRFTLRFVTLSFAGVVTYVVLPAAPPWLAARQGALGPGVHVQRSVVRGFHVLHLDLAKPIFSDGQAAVNLTAALPSLHAAFAALVSVFFWARVRNPLGRAILALYPLAMAFSLVLSGEHYVIDILMGWVYVAVVMAGWAAVDRRVARRRAEDAAVTEDRDDPEEAPIPVEAIRTRA